MQIKKRYVVIAVVLLLGLTSFTFASPREVEKQKPAKGVSERVANDKKENRSYAEALEAVEDAEENPTLDTVETARNEIRNADDATAEQITQLQNRVDEVEETIDVAALVTEVETLAEVKETRETAKEKYPNAETEVNKLEDGDVKDNLQKRLEKVSRLLSDTEAPKITGVDEINPTNKNEIIYISDEFLTSVTINGTEYTEKDFTIDGELLKFQKKVTKEGTHTVVALDKLGNESTKTFVIDKTAAKKNAVNANVNGYKNNVSEQYATNGNTVTAYISINEELQYNPTFTFYANGKEIKVIAKEDVVARPSSNANYPYVYEVKLTIDENLVAEDGDLTFTVTDIVDKAGNKTADITKVSNGKVVKLDRTPNRVTFTTIATDNNTVDGKVYYVTNGNTVTFRMGVREKFSENPVVTIGGKEVTLEYVKYFAQPNHHEYRGTLKLDETLTDGNLNITITGSKDLAGNKGFYYQTNGKKVLETITKKETTNGKSLVYDNTAPVLSYVAMLSKADNYKYAKNGDTIRFLVAYNEEVELNDNFVITFNNKTKKLVRSGDKSKYEYIAEFKIPADEKDLAEGLLTFEVKGAQDKLGNEALDSTTANHYKYNSVTYDRTAPALTVKPESVGVDPYYTSISYKLSDNTLIDYYTINGYKADVTNDKWGDANYDNLKSHLVAGENKITLYDVAGNKVEKTFQIAENTAKEDDGIITITEDMYLVNEPFYNVKENEKPVTINGNGHTVTQFVTDVEQFNWTESGSRPTVGNMLSSVNGSKITVNDLTFAGTTQSISLGHYLDYKKVGLAATYNFHSEMNNVNVIGLNVVSYSAGIAPAVVVYGTANLNNVNIYDTKLSELDTDPMWPVYDLGLVNYTTTTLNGCKIGSIYMWKHAKLTVKAGTTVDSINVTLGTPMANIVVEEGATVNKVITKDGEMTYEDWIESTTPVGQLKLTAKNGGTYTFTESLTLDEILEIPSDKTVVLDLNNKELKFSNKEDFADRLLKNAGNLTVKNGTLVNDKTHAYGFMENAETGEVTFENINITDKGNNNSSAILNNGKIKFVNSKYNGTASAPGNAFINSTGDLEITNSEINSVSTKAYSVIIHSGKAVITDTKVAVTRGGVAVIGGDVTINNANIQTKTGTNSYYAVYVVEESDAKLTINGGKYTGYKAGLYAGHADKGNLNVTINAGTFTGTRGNASAVIFAKATTTPTHNVEFTIKGGTYKGNKHDVSAYLPEGYEQNSTGEVVKKD